MDFAVNGTSDFALGHMEKSSLVAKRQVFHSDPANFVEGLMAHVTVNGTDRHDRVEQKQIDVEMKAVITGI